MVLDVPDMSRPGIDSNDVTIPSGHIRQDRRPYRATPHCEDSRHFLTPKSEVGEGVDFALAAHRHGTATRFANGRPLLSVSGCSAA